MSAPAQVVILAFNTSNQLAVRRAGTRLGLAFVGADEGMAVSRLETCFKEHTAPAEYFSCTAGALGYRVFFSQVDTAPASNSSASSARPRPSHCRPCWPGSNPT